MQVIWSYQLVMLCIKVFGKIMGKIFLSWMPCDVKFLYFNLVGDPKEVFLHGSRSLFFYRIVCDGYSCCVVAVDWSWQLSMPKFLQCEL